MTTLLIKIAAITLLILLPAGKAESTLVINEFVASNDSMPKDFEGDYPDWIELYNTGDDYINLSDYIISDDYPASGWQLPNYELEAGAFFLLFASGKNLYMYDIHEFHTDFRIGSSGNHLVLADLDGDIVDEVSPVKLKTNISYGRFPDGGNEWYFFRKPTPGEPNITQKYHEIVSPPAFSHLSGYYASAFMLRLNTNSDKVDVYYTLDGSVPDTNSLKYKSAFLIYPRTGEVPKLSQIKTADEDWHAPDKNLEMATVVRALAFKKGSIESEVVNRTFFTGNHFSNLHQLKVTSIISDPEGLFDYDRGIYVPGRIYDENFDPDIGYPHRPANYNQRGLEWEREAYLSIFDNDWKEAFSQGAGIRIHGNTSRALPIKSLRLYARGRYGGDWFDYPLFDDKDLPAVRRFILRNSGQDRTRTLFRDAFIHRLFKDMNFERQAFRPSVLYINGEYWGIHNFRERIDPHYFTANFNIPPEHIEMTTDDSDFYGSSAFKQMLIDYVTDNDMTEDVHFDILSHIFDMDNYIDYNIAQIFIANVDWPGNNIEAWRNKFSNSLWRWIFFDTDFGYGNQGKSDHNTLLFAIEEGGTSWPNPEWSTVVLRNLFKNKVFRDRFIERFSDNLNSTFRSEKAIQLIRNIKEQIEPEIDMHIKRWPHLESKENWESEIKVLENFAFDRPFYIRKYLESFYGLKGSYELSLNIKHPDSNLGYIRVNSIDVSLYSGSWTGRYFKGIPVEIEAVPFKGARFVRWLGDETGDSSQFVLNSEKDIMLIAEFTTAQDYEHNLTYPTPFNLSQKTPYRFTNWSPNRPAGNYPESMVFHQINLLNSGINDEPTSDWKHAYHYTEGASFRGLRSNGILFNGDKLPLSEAGAAYPSSIVLALDTRNVDNAVLKWTCGTYQQTNNPYGLVLQYRIGSFGHFSNLTDRAGNPYTYVSAANDHQKSFEVNLPPFLINRTNVQLRWKYYQLHQSASGIPASVFINEIQVMPKLKDKEEISEEPKLIVYPNPSRGLFKLKFENLENEVSQNVELHILDMTGRIVDYSNKRINIEQKTNYINALNLENGTYILRVKTEEGYIFSERLIIHK